MLQLERATARRLQQMRVRIDVPDAHTLFLRNVPTNASFFNKAHTNVLIKRPREGMPFLIFVDEDLACVGDADPSLARALVGGQARDGWRVLQVGGYSDVQTMVENALAALGSDGGEPQPPAPIAGAHSPGTRAPTELLASFGTDLTQRVRDDQAEPTVGRDDAIDDVCATVTRWGAARMPVIVGESGVGKTNLLNGVARRLAERQPAWQVVAVALGDVFAGTLFDAERENLLSRLMREATSGNRCVALEHIELALVVPDGRLLVSQALDAGARIIGTALPAQQARLAQAPLARRVSVVSLPEPEPSQTLEILGALVDRIAAHHGVEIVPSCLPAAVRAAGSLPGCFPAKAVTLLDSAAARASLGGAAVVGIDDICFAASQPDAAFGPQTD